MGWKKKNKTKPWRHLCTQLVQKPPCGPNLPGKATGPPLPASPLTLCHTLQGCFLYFLKATNHISLSLGTAECWGQERTQYDFTWMNTPESGSVSSPAVLIASGRGSDECKDRTAQKRDIEPHKSPQTAGWKTLPSGRFKNPKRVKLPWGREIIFENITNRFLYYLILRQH